MDVKKALEEKIREISGDASEELIGKIKELAEVDYEIHGSLDELEPISQSAFEKHNELATAINDLVDDVTEKAKANGIPITGHKVEVKVIRVPKFIGKPLEFLFRLFGKA